MIKKEYQKPTMQVVEIQEASIICSSVAGISSNVGLTLGEKSNNQPAARRPSRNIWDGGDDWDE